NIEKELADLKENILKITSLYGTTGNNQKRELQSSFNKLEAAISVTRCCDKLPSIEKLWSMADTIVDRQKKVLDAPNKETIDWEDLTEDWFDWLGDEIVGN
ncbi:MAG: hypothetical protein ACJAVA_000250, partial [Flavobacteriaceae bacterium]